MRVVLRLAALAVTVAAAVVLPGAAANASPHVSVTIAGGQGYEFLKGCTNTQPFSCYTHNVDLPFSISVANMPQSMQSISVSYTTVNGTATAPADYQATSGTVTIQRNFPQAFLSVPLVNDGIAESTETFTVKITSTNPSATIGPPATMQINDGGNVPADCDFSRSTVPSISLSCTSRPPTQQWQIHILCQEEPFGNDAYGNVVTGNGTSTATCPNNELADGEGMIFL
jgi:Calx-beta domain-containing protein